jgi:hypothetical protein
VENPELANAAWWYWFWELIGTISFFGVVLTLAIEFGAARLAAPYRAILDNAREERISAANERAAKAELELAKLKTPRSISVELRNRIVEQMKQFAPQEYAGRVSAGSDDAWNLWREISLALELSGWKRVPPIPPIGQPPYGPPATIASAAMPGVMVWFPGTGWNDIRPKAVALAKVLRDDGNGILAAPGPIADNSKTITIEIGPNPHQPASVYHGPDP